MKKIILLAVLAVAIVAMPAFASVNNIKVSGSVDSTWLYRDDLNFGVSKNTGSELQNLAITQTMVQVEAELTENVSTTVCLINERPWNQKGNSTAGDNINIHYAYATLREMLYSPLTVVVGRQAFKYGNSFIVDSTGSNNTAPLDSGLNNVAEDLTKQTALDAVRLIFDYNPLSLELLWAKVSANDVTAKDDDDDIDLYGVNVNYELGDAWNSLVETYFFTKIDKNAETAAAVANEDKIYVPGVRASTNPVEGLNIQAELAWQGGQRVSSAAADVNQKRSAMGGQLITNYQLPVLENWNPNVEYVYTYVSGEKNVNTGGQNEEKYSAWDPMFENQGGGKIYNAIFDLTNMHIHSASLAFNPMEDLTTKFSWTGLWFAKKWDQDTFTLIQPDGSNTTVDINRFKRNLGFELDLDAVYDYTEDVQIGASLGAYFPGRVFEKHTTPSTGSNQQPAFNLRESPDNIAKQALVHMNVNF